MSYFKKFNKWFDENSSKILWIILALQALIVAIVSYPK